MAKTGGFCYWADSIAIRGEFFPRKLPAYTLLQVSAFAHPDWLIEIEALAVLGRFRRRERGGYAQACDHGIGAGQERGEES
jgi:hypothetical protein